MLRWFIQTAMCSQTLHRWLRIGFVVAVSGFVLVAVLLYWNVKDTVVLSHPAATALLEDRYGRFLSEGGSSTGQELGYWALSDQIPERVVAAFLVTEDRRFYDHAGIDWRALLRAARHNVTTATRQGGSTIAMQVARMQAEQTTSANYRRTYWNKLCESVTAVLLIQRFGHQTVLKQYLEIVPQGNRIHGVAYAARRYFQKPLQDVSWAEAAVLAALPKAPGTMNLFTANGRRKAFARADQILHDLHAQGAFSTEELAAARRQLATLTIPDRETRPEHSYHAILRLQELLPQTIPQPSYTRPARASLDLRIQEKAAAVAAETIRQWRVSGAGNIALMVVEKPTGKVVAYVGSHTYYEADYAGSINYARVPRSSGSTLKPFIYALGLETRKFTPASLLSDQPMLVSLPRGYARISNYDDQNLGWLPYRKALANSRNVPAIHVLANVGVDQAYAFLRQVGLVHTNRPAGHYGVGLAIGTLYVTLEDLVAAYGVLANDGKAFHLRWFESETSEPNALQSAEQLLDANVARQISLFLSDPLARLPTFSRMGALEYPFPVAVKTGTSQGFRDAWAVAYSANYIVGVWLGHPDNTRMGTVSGTSAAQAAKTLMLWLHPAEQRGVGEQVFRPPEGYTLMAVCAATGRPATGNCAEVIPEYFRPGTEPTISNPLAYQSISQPSNIARTGQTDQQFIPLTQPLTTALAPFSLEKLLHASVTIHEPLSGAVFVRDPETPPGMQTLPLQATASPAVPALIWYVDGQPFTQAAYPYAVRWPLTPGIHTIQARFAHADITSEVVTIRVD